jgi:hypothetical protein
MDTMKNTNYLINWNGDTAKDAEDKIHYFNMLRKMLLELEEISKVHKILDRYNVYFIDVDEIPRVNIDEPIRDLIWKKM